MSRKPLPEKQPPFVHRVRPQVVIKYRDSIKEIPDLPSEGLEGSLLTPGWKDFRLRFPGVRNRRLLRPAPEVIRSIGKQAGARDPRFVTRRLDNYMVLDLPEGVSPREVRDFARRHQLSDAVEFAYVTPPPVPPPTGYPADVAEGGMQSYLESADKGGIDARYAWDRPGGDGRDLTLYDVEWGWAQAHEDLPVTQVSIISGHSYSYFHHGTAAVGIAAGVAGNGKCIGIAPRVKSVLCASSWRDSAGVQFDIADAIWDVIQHVFTQGVTGAVLLLEEQTDFDGVEDVPAESIPAVREMVKLATAMGITVVAAAGNGGVDLDALTDGEKRAFLNPDSPDHVDSGAILVGAATASPPYERMAESNYGKRVNCFARGEGVYSPTTDAYGLAKDRYGYALGYTSAAAAIVAGAALAVQGIAVASSGVALDARKVRDLLADPARATGTAAPGDRIGVMPNLRRIIDDGRISRAGIA